MNEHQISFLEPDNACSILSITLKLTQYRLMLNQEQPLKTEPDCVEKKEE